VPPEIVTMLQGAILIFAVGGEFFIANRIRPREKVLAELSEEVEAA